MRRDRRLAHVIDLDGGGEVHVEASAGAPLRVGGVALAPGDRVYRDGASRFRLLKSSTSKRAGTYRGAWWVRRAGR